MTRTLQQENPAFAMEFLHVNANQKALHPMHCAEHFFAHNVDFNAHLVGFFAHLLAKLINRYVRAAETHHHHHDKIAAQNRLRNILYINFML